MLPMTRSFEPGVRRKLIVRSAAAGLAITGLVPLWHLWQGTPYPVGQPSATARRLDRQTQNVCDALGLPAAGLDRTWVGGISGHIYDCPRRGLAHWTDQLTDTPPMEPHTFTVSDTWALTGVTHPQAVRALHQARQTLTRQGWTVTSYEDSPPRLLSLELKTPSADAIHVTLYPGHRLAVEAYAGCASYPDGTPTDAEGQPYLPAPTAPVQLTGR